MTETQVKYWDYKERQRHDLVTEGQTERMNASNISLNLAQEKKIASDIQVNSANIAYTNMRTQLTASEIQKTKAQTSNVKADTNLKKAQTSKVKAETQKVKAETTLTKAKIQSEIANKTLTETKIKNYVLDQLNHGNTASRGVATMGYLAEIMSDPKQASDVKHVASRVISSIINKAGKSDEATVVTKGDGTYYLMTKTKTGSAILKTGQAIKNWFKKYLYADDAIIAL